MGYSLWGRKGIGCDLATKQQQNAKPNPEAFASFPVHSLCVQFIHTVSKTVSFNMSLHFNVIFFIFHVLLHFSRGTIWVPSQLLFLEHLSFFFFFLILFYLTLQYCIGFAIYQNESATGIHVFPILNLPPSSLPIPSLWVVPAHQPQASSIVHRTWTGDSFHI